MWGQTIGSQVLWLASFIYRTFLLTGSPTFSVCFVVFSEQKDFFFSINPCPAHTFEVAQPCREQDSVLSPHLPPHLLRDVYSKGQRAD